MYLLFYDMWCDVLRTQRNKWDEWRRHLWHSFGILLRLFEPNTVINPTTLGLIIWRAANGQSCLLTTRRCWTKGAVSGTVQARITPLQMRHGSELTIPSRDLSSHVFGVVWPQTVETLDGKVRGHWCSSLSPLHCTAHELISATLYALALGLKGLINQSCGIFPTPLSAWIPSTTAPPVLSCWYLQW